MSSQPKRAAAIRCRRSGGLVATGNLLIGGSSLTGGGFTDGYVFIELG